MRTFCDAYHQEFESYQHSILDISGEKTAALFDNSCSFEREGARKWNCIVSHSLLEWYRHNAIVGK